MRVVFEGIGGKGLEILAKTGLNFYVEGDGILVGEPFRATTAPAEIDAFTPLNEPVLPIKRRNAEAPKQLWTKADDRLLKGLVLEGKTPEEIAEKLWRTVRSVQQRISRKKLKRQKKKKEAQPFNYFPWSEADKKTILELRAEGLSYKEVGGRVGRTASSIANAVRKLQKGEM